MTRTRWFLLLAVVALGVGGWQAFVYLKLHGLGLLSRIMDPIQPPRAVVWDAGPSAPAAPSGERPPNIVVIVADDLGYNDLTFNGGGVADGAVPTPHIDSIARAGVQFTAGYAGNATCAPSRAAILTGRYPTRFGFEFTPAPKIFMRLVARMTRDQPGAQPPIYHDEREKDVPSMDQQGVPPAEITLAELLRAQGYHTLGFGKWHLGEPKQDWLFHLDQDPSEHVNLAAKSPDKVRELKAVLAAHEAEMVQPAWPPLIEAAIDIDHPLGVPRRPSDEYVYWEN